MTIQSKSSKRIPQSSSLNKTAACLAAVFLATAAGEGSFSINNINNGAAAGIIIGVDAFTAHRPSTTTTISAAARSIRPAARSAAAASSASIANIGGGNSASVPAGIAPTAAAPAAKSRSARTASSASASSSSAASAAVVLRAFRTDNEQQQQQQQQQWQQEEETAEDATIDAVTSTSATSQPKPTATTKDSNGATKNGAIDIITTTATSSAAAKAAAPTGSSFELVPSPELAAKLAAKQAAEAAASSESPLSSLFWRGIVVALCALWASNFAAAKLVMSEPGVDSSLYAVSRFTVAALALLPGTLNAIRKNPNVVDGETIKSAAVCGSWVAFGYLGQTLGLLTTTASRSCVICSLHCVFVAIIAEVWRTNRAREAGKLGKSTEFDLKRLIPAIIAVTGVAIVELQGAAGGPGVGDALSVAQPIGFGMGYLQLEEIMAKKPEAALPVSAIKLLVVATASMGMFELSPLLHSAGGGDAGGLADALSNLSLQMPDFGAILSSPLALGGILYTGLITTALALWIESIAFARVPATDASIILTTEPIFAAGAGAVTLGETFGMSDYVGASLIVGACVLATLMDVPGDEQCEVGSDGAMLGECEPPKQWPTGGGGGGF